MRGCSIYHLKSCLLFLIRLIILEAYLVLDIQFPEYQQ